MISPAMLGTADDGKRLVLYPLEITLRDYFAAAALPSLLVDSWWRNQMQWGGHPGSPHATATEATAAQAYKFADAMLAERAK